MTSTTRRAILIVGSLVALLLVLALALPAMSRIIQSTSEVSHDLPADLTSLTLHGDVGDIDVRAADADEEPGAVATIRSGLSTPTVDAEVNGDAAVLSNTCRAAWWDNCAVSWEVVVPAESSVVIDHSVGDITVADIVGPVAIDSSVGSISATGLRGHTVRAHSSVGDVNITFAEPPENLQVSSSTGDLTITVPDDGSAYRVETNTSVGSISNVVGSDPSQTRVIDVRTSVGDITIRRAP